MSGSMYVYKLPPMYFVFLVDMPVGSYSEQASIQLLCCQVVLSYVLSFAAFNLRVVGLSPDCDTYIKNPQSNPCLPDVFGS